MSVLVIDSEEAIIAGAEFDTDIEGKGTFTLDPKHIGIPGGRMIRVPTKSQGSLQTIPAALRAIPQFKDWLSINNLMT